MPTNTYTVTGMSCTGCVASVSEEIGELDGVTDVSVELTTGAVTLTSSRPLDESQVRGAVEEAGYQLV